MSRPNCEMVSCVKGINITADTVNGVGRIKKLWGKTGLGAIVNLFDGKFRQGNNEGTATESRLYSTQILYLEKGMEYTFLTNLNLSVYNYGVQLLSAKPPTVSGNRFFDSLWRTESSYTFIPEKSGYFGICIRKQNETNITVNEMNSVKFELYSKYSTIKIVSKNGNKESSNICYIKNGLSQGDYIDYSKKKVVRANGTEEDIDCSDKIVQYSDTTTVYNTDGAEIEVSLTNNKAIAEVNKNLEKIEKSYVEDKIEAVDVVDIKVGDIASLMQNKFGKLITITINLKLTITANSYTKIAQLKQKPVQGFFQTVAFINNQYASEYTTKKDEMLVVDADGSVNIRSLSAHTNEYARIYLTYLTTD